VVRVIKSLRYPLEAGNNLSGIDDNVREGTRPGKEMFLDADGRLTDGADITLSGRLFQMVGPASGDREGPAADGRQYTTLNS